jgi:hypothetical protein
VLNKGRTFFSGSHSSLTTMTDIWLNSYMNDFKVKLTFLKVSTSPIIPICVSVLLLWQIPEKINLREEKFILAHGIRGFSPWLAGSIAFRPLARQNFMAEGCGGRKLLTAWQSGSQEWQERVGDKKYPSKVHTPSYLLPPNNPHLVVFTISQYCHQVVNSSVDWLIHW